MNSVTPRSRTKSSFWTICEEESELSFRIRLPATKDFVSDHNWLISKWILRENLDFFPKKNYNKPFRNNAKYEFITIS